MVEDLLDLDDSKDTELDFSGDQTNLSVPDTCTEEGCDRDTHERRHERNPQFRTEPHKDAPRIEGVCPRHGLI